MEDKTTSGNRAKTTQAPKKESMDLEQSVKVMMEQMQELKKENEMLKSMQDPTQLAAAQAKSDTDKRKRVRLRILNNKLVTGWDRLKANDVRVYRGEIEETQIMNVHYHDNTEEEITVKDFNDLYKVSPPVAVESEAHDKAKNITMFTVEIPGWNKLDHEIDLKAMLIEINSIFVN